MSDFTFSISDQEKEYLLSLVKLSIMRKLNDEGSKPIPEPPTKKMREFFGAFVTLKIRDRLRGCIGHIIGDRPLFKTVYNMARSAAFEDPRFPPLQPEEFEQLELEISIMSPLEPCPDPEKIEVGRHGLVVRKGVRSGLLLPQVPVEWNWDRKTFLKQTCLKAGLEADCAGDPDTELFWFEAVVFGDE